MINNILVEVCCGSIDDCIVAEKCGADRIELNHALEMGGMTPSIASLKHSKQHTTIPICCMVRPRGVGFSYTENQFKVMLDEARDLIAAGADGIVFGFLHDDATINIERTKAMVDVIHPKEAIFHKAFDSSRDLEESIQQLIDCGIDRILTSGGSSYPDIEEGCRLISKLNEKYGDKIQLLPGGGVREHNVQEILKLTGSNQIHMTAKHLVLDPSTKDFGTTNHEASAHSFVATEEKQLLSIMKKISEFTK